MGKTRVALTILALATACLLGVSAAPALAEDAAPNGTDALQLQDDEIVASGDWGTCPWTIDSTGKLTVRPGTGGEAFVEDDEGIPYSIWYDYKDIITSIVFVKEGGRKAIAPANLSHFFDELSNVVSIDLSGLDTSKVEDMGSMFEGCSSLAALDLSSFDTSKVRDMFSMFEGCSSLASLDLSSFDTSKVRVMYYMFRDCSSLAALDLSSFDTSKVWGMGSMFEGCSSLAALDLSSFDTSNVTGMGDMFRDCSSLTTLDLSSFDTSKVEGMGGTFRNCSSLTTLDLSSFDTSKVESMNAMFSGCMSLKTIYASDLLTTDALEPGWAGDEETFYGCTSLVGGNGTIYSAEHVDAGYARIDAPGTPGYLTKKAYARELAGANRYATAAAIAKKAYPNGADGVIVATGANFPDALGASSLAGVLDWPILLTEPGSLSQATYDAIVGLGAGGAIIVGGTGAVSPKVEQQLQGLVGGVDNVGRLSGDDRYRTALDVYREGRGSWGTTAIIATGGGYADALSISGWAFASKSPIFLCDAKKGLTADTEEAISAGGFERIVIVGGTGVVPASVENWIKANVTDDVTRLGGANRYETSRLIAGFVLKNGGTANGACIATGRNFPDALAGGALVGRNDSILLLADPSDLTALALLADNAEDIAHVYYLGGIGAVPQSVRDAVERAVS